MSKATITLSDTDGALDLFCDYGEGGLNEFSPAHQAARRLIDLMGEMLEPNTEQIHLTAEEVQAMRINSASFPSTVAENAAQFAKLRAETQG